MIELFIILPTIVYLAIVQSADNARLIDRHVKINYELNWHYRILVFIPLIGLAELAANYSLLETVVLLICIIQLFSLLFDLILNLKRFGFSGLFYVSEMSPGDKIWRVLMPQHFTHKWWPQLLLLIASLTLLFQLRTYPF